MGRRSGPPNSARVDPVCLITGAGGRLGNALCARLMNRSHIVAVYRERVPAVPSQLRMRVNGDNHRSVYCVQADLRKRDDIRRVIEIALARYGRIDVLVNSAADIRFHGKLIELWETDPYASAQMHLNCVAPMLLASAIFQDSWKDSRQANLRRNRCIVNVSSKSGLDVYGTSGQAFYGASKAALNLLTRYLAAELEPYGIRANALCPGGFRDTKSTSAVVDEIEKLINSKQNGVVLEMPVAGSG